MKSVNGYRLAEGQLQFSGSPKTTRCALLPDALTVVARGQERELKWESAGFGTAGEGAGYGWSAYGLPPSRYERSRVVVCPNQRAVGPHLSTYATTDRDVAVMKQPRLMVRFGWHSFPALLNYLAWTPVARVALSDESQVMKFLAHIAAGPVSNADLPGTPILGTALDLHHAIVKCLSTPTYRWFDGRFVDNEPRPEPRELVGAVRLHLSHQRNSDIDDEEIVRRLSVVISMRGWPFGVLLC